MIIKELRIQNLGRITHFSKKFDDGLNVLRDYRRDELSLAIRFIFNHKIPPPPNISAGVDTRIEAVVLLAEKEYRVVATPNNKGKCKLFCQDESLKDVTSEYLYLTTHAYEQDLTDVFSGNEEEIFLRFLKYANEDLYYAKDELSRDTGGLSNIKAFRRYLREFIESFEPELLRDGKGYEIVLRKNGRYDVKCRAHGFSSNMLSESERVMFKFLCFLRTAEFWHGFEEIRNLHSVKKPLLISGFLEKLDESIDVGELLLRTEKLKRQTILITNETIERGY
jgi:hypothetical protein